MRLATAERHAILDAGLAIGGPDPTLAHYREHLCMLRAWLVPLQAWLARFDDGPQDTPARVGVIEADLAADARGVHGG